MVAVTGRVATKHRQSLKIEAPTVGATVHRRVAWINALIEFKKAGSVVPGNLPEAFGEDGVRNILDGNLALLRQHLVKGVAHGRYLGRLAVVIETGEAEH